MKLFSRPKRSVIFNSIDRVHLQLTKKIKTNPDSVTHDELARAMMYGYALDMVVYADKNYKLNLDFSDDSIKDVENIIMTFHDQLNDKVTDDMVKQYSKMIGAYIGTVAEVRHQYKWELAQDNGVPTAYLAGPGGKTINIIGQVTQQILNGSEDSVWAVYSILISGKAKEISVEELLAKSKNK